MSMTDRYSLMLAALFIGPLFGCVELVPRLADNGSTDAGTVADGGEPSTAVDRCEKDQFAFDGRCEPCEPGSTNPGGDDPTDGDTACEAILCVADEFVIANTCVECPAGSTNVAGDEATGGNTSCDVIVCAQNQYVASNRCVDCAQGSENAAGDLATGDDTECDGTRCAENTYVFSNVCVPCEPGSTNAGGDDALGVDTACDPILCDANEYVADNVCTACAPGSTNAPGDDATGDDTACEPTLCGPHEYVVDHVCTACPPGSTNAAGDDATDEDTSCDAIICGRDERVVNNACVSCAPGSTNAEGDVATGSDTTCEPILCRVGERVSGHACVPCPPGSANAAGDDATGPDTACEAIFCGADQYVLNHACVPCPPGSTNGPGDNATLADTSCDPVFCAANQYVVNNACVSCPPGSTNRAGDDARGPNTRCDDTICGRNEYVLNHGCVVCPAGTTNVAGDNAAGPNTMCDSDSCSMAFGVSCADFDEAYVKPSNTNVGAGDRFGWWVSLSEGGDTMVVSTPGDDSGANGIGANAFDQSATQAGAAHVYVRNGQSWTLQAYVKASASTSNAFFGAGSALSASGDIMVVSAGGEDTERGAVYVFERHGGSWNQSDRLTSSNRTTSDFFGDAVAVSRDGGYIAVGAALEDTSNGGINPSSNNSLMNSGAVYIFNRTGPGQWSQQAFIKASSPGALDQFGWSVALSANGDWMAVSARNDDGVANALTDSGAVYVFSRSGSTWTQRSILRPTTLSAGDTFGESLGLSSDGTTLVVGAPYEDSNATNVNGSGLNNSVSESGAAHVYVRSGSSWSYQAYLKAPNTGAGDLFGSKVAISDSGDTIVVSAPDEDSSATGVDGNGGSNGAPESGAVVVYTRSGTTWRTAGYVKASNTGTADRFGFSLAISGDGGTMAVGADLEDSSATGINGNQSSNGTADSGAAYVRRIAPFTP